MMNTDMSILETLAQSARVRTERKKKDLPLEEIRDMAYAMGTETGFPFERALRGGSGLSLESSSGSSAESSSEKSDIAFICEVKRASPSKGIIASDFPYLQIAMEYEEAGAAAISCLTEPAYFMGSDTYLQEIASCVSIPVLRKDFTVDPYMIYEAKILGASAVLLICSILRDEELIEYGELAHSLGLSVLVEAHDEMEVERALKVKRGIIGVNNRNLRDFTVDCGNSVRLRKLVPPDRLFVSESGIRTAEDIALLRQNGTNAVLIGETLMKSPDKAAQLRKLRGLL